jgi:hypothetical protein
MGEYLYKEHWLYQWIDEEGIKTSGDYMKAIRKRGSFDRLRETSDRVMSSPSSQRGNASTSVLASRRLDFSGYVSCAAFGCMRPIVDNVFSRVWHYFDTVVIDEEPLDDMFFTGNDVFDVLQPVKLLLYLRAIGAEKYLSYTEKIAGICGDHFREHAEEHHLGLDVLYDEEFERTVIQDLVSKGTFRPQLRGEDWHFDIRHPTFGQVVGTVDHSDPRHPPTNQEMALSAFGRFCAALISDVSASRALGLPLLDAAENSWVPNVSRSNELNDRVVALNMRLPVLANAPVKEVMHYREENQASFEKFRRALREAIKEQIERTGTDSPEAIAQEVVATRIQPELADIELQLSGIRKTLARKIGANITLTGAAVSVGALERIPLVIAATAAAAATSLYQILNSNVESRQRAEESDWYFLWKAQHKHRH